MKTREKILLAAQREFAEYGLAGARVDRLARRCRVNKAMIYYHFGSKERLYQVVIDDYVARIGDILRENMAEESDLEAHLKKIADFLNSEYAWRKGLIPILLREIAAGGERIKPALIRLFSDQGAARKLQQLIEDGIKRKQYRQIDSKQAMISFMGMNLFYVMMVSPAKSIWEIKDEKKFKRERSGQVVDLFLHGLKVR